MGFLDWIKGVFGTKPITRDVSKLDRDSSDPDQVREVVDLSGGPLKKNHRRRALRDRRLLPKKVEWDPKLRRKKQIMSAKEADRLFAGTLRTKDRNIRDLLPDEAQLARYGLPMWRTESELAAGLGISMDMLRHFAIHRAMERANHYVSFAIAKRSGGERIIRAPKKRLKKIQRTVLRELVDKLPIHSAAHGFVRRRSVATNARPHVGAQIMLKVDLKDFFPTITYGRVRGLLIALGYGYPVAAALAVLMTEAERQPVVIGDKTYHVPVGPRVTVQGAPTSPGVANAIVLKMDRRLDGIARKLGFTYTRYADDMTFSSKDKAAPVTKLLGSIRRIVDEEGFALNADKTRTSRPARRMQVTGVTVNQVMGLSRPERRKMRAMKHQLEKAPDPKRQAQLEGKIAYLAMLNPEQAKKI